MGREIRKVPANWEHPRKDDGCYQPMFDEYYGDALAEWLKDNDEWEKGTHPSLLNNPSLKEEYPFYSMWNGNAPDVKYYRTKKYLPEELTHIQLYETTTEGTPKTPVFRADELDKLCEYAAEHVSVFGSIMATKEECMEMLGSGMVGVQIGNAIIL